MPLEPAQQIITHIKKKKNILITTNAHPSGDSIASALAFYIFAKKTGKRATLAIDQGKTEINSCYSFLAGYENILPGINNNKEALIEFELNGNNIRGLTYSVKEGKLTVRVIPEQNNFTLNQPTIKHASYGYDLIVVLDSSDLESIGSIYEDHMEFFYHTPIINIDHKADNEHFGELNLVELTAVSTTEILFNLIEGWQKNLLNEQIGTCLLAGIIHESKSFQTPNITPRTLAIASELMSLGAKRELIIEKLFHNKPINMLRLWGKALANLKTDPKTGIVWSFVSEQDFSETQTSSNQLLGALEDMLSHTPQAKAVILLYPKEGRMRALIHTHQIMLDLRKILSPLNAHGEKNLVTVELTDKNITNAVETIKNALHAGWPKEEIMPEF